MKESELIDLVQKIVHEYMANMITKEIVEEHAAAERAIQNNGWVDFDPENTEDLIDDANYLIRQQDSEGRWGCPHMAYWLKEEQAFYLLHTLIAIAPQVDQYFKIPE
jgi:hypothetical protein